MTFKIDENLPAELADMLREAGHDADTMHAEGLTGRSDMEVRRAAFADDRAIITSDLDFSDIRQFEPGTHPGIVLFRVSREGRAEILARFRGVIKEAALSTWTRCLIVITPTKIRVRRPMC